MPYGRITYADSIGTYELDPNNLAEELRYYADLRLAARQRQRLQSLYAGILTAVVFVIVWLAFGA